MYCKLLFPGKAHVLYGTVQVYWYCTGMIIRTPVHRRVLVERRTSTVLKEGLPEVAITNR